MHQTLSAEPNCLGVRADLRVRARVGSVSGVGRVVVDRAVCDHVLALVVVLDEMRKGARRNGKRKSKMVR